MDHKDKIPVDTGTDWEEAFHLYRNAIAREDEVFRVRATIKLASMSNVAPEDILARTIPVLLELLGDSFSDLCPSIQEASAHCLKRIACRGEGRLATLIGESGVVSSVLSLLQRSDGSLQVVLLKCLRNIVVFGAPNRMIVVRNGGLEVILNMLNACCDSLKKPLLEILSALALAREARKIIFRLGSVPLLVESARHGSMLSRVRAAQAIGLLGLVKRARHFLVVSGAIPVLIELLEVGDTSTKLVAGNALGVISAHIDYTTLIVEAGGIPLFAQLLCGSESMGKEIAEDVFCILSMIEENAAAIMQHLVRILREDNAGAKAAAADVIWDLSGNKHLQPLIQNSGAIPVMVQLLRDEDVNLRENVSGAIAQLSYSDGGRLELANSGAIPLLIDILQSESEELRDNAAETLFNFSEDPILRDSITDVLNSPNFQRMQDRLLQIRASDAHLSASLSSYVGNARSYL